MGSEKREAGSNGRRPATGPAYHLAQYNVATLRAPLDDPRLADFVANLERINTLGDRSHGFVWRLHDASGNSTAVRVDADPRVIVNFTVWESIEALFAFAYHSDHVEFYRRRKEWFEHDGRPYLVLWWTPAGRIPPLEEAVERLEHLRAHGPTPHAFTFKQRFDPPSPTASGAYAAVRTASAQNG